MMFPPSNAQVYRNEAGEPLGWDIPPDDDVRSDLDEVIDPDYDVEMDDYNVEDDDEALYCEQCEAYVYECIHTNEEFNT